MNTYEVIIDLESKHIQVEAENKEEAEEKAINEYEKYIKNNPMAEEYWVGDIDEVK